MKRSLAGGFAVVLLLCGAYAGVMAAQRDAVLKALEDAAANLGKSGHTLTWGAVESNGDPIRPDVTVRDLVVTLGSGEMALTIERIEVEDLDAADDGTIWNSDVIKLVNASLSLAIRRLDVPIGGSLSVTGLGSADEVSLRGPNIDALLALSRGERSLFNDDPRQAFDAFESSVLDIRGLSYDGSFMSDAPSSAGTRSGAPAEIGTQGTKIGFRLAAIRLEDVASDGFGALEGDGFLLTAFDASQLTLTSSTRIDRISAEDADFSHALAVYARDGARADLLDLFFGVTVAKIDLINSLREDPFVVIVSDHDTWTYTPGDDNDRDSIDFVSEKVTVTPAAGNPFAGIVERAIGGRSLVAEFRSTLWYDLDERDIAAEFDFRYANLVRLDGGATLIDIPSLPADDPSRHIDGTGKKSAHPGLTVLEEWEMGLQDLGLRDIAATVVGQMSVPPKDRSMVFNDMVATLDQFAAAVDPNIAPLTYAALQALKTFVRIGGTLRAYSETPRELGVDTTDRAFINVFDDFEIIVQHTPPH